MEYSFSSYLYTDENTVMSELLSTLVWNAQRADDVHASAVDLVEKTRNAKGKGGQLEAFLQEFSLNTEEGLAMMCLAEALLRIPDADTANALIKDKVAAANWLQKQGDGSKDWMAKAAGFGMALTRKTLDSSLSRLGEPIIREAMIKAMQMMGRQFVLGTDIDDALSHARQWERQGYRMSYDVLGEGARDAETAERYFNKYAAAIEAIAKKNKESAAGSVEGNAGISVKLSALYPRYTYSQKELCIPALTQNLKALAVLAAGHGMPLTVDAEEANRLDLSIAIFEDVLMSPELAGWDGFGLAMQAYQKRCLPLIKHVAAFVKKHDRRIQIRLVKGAYWDTEIKHAQMHGFGEYPVFTRKTNTDVSYLACAQEMLRHADNIYSMFATHNAHTLAAVRDMAGDKPFEFQRLHGMGDSLYAQIIGEENVACSVYAPVGPHRDLLPYLVRRLLENGANSSFVNQLLDKKVDAPLIVRDPVNEAQDHDDHRHPAIPLPKDIFGQERQNSKGEDLDDPSSSGALVRYIGAYKDEMKAFSLIGGKRFDKINESTIEVAFEGASAAQKLWDKTDIQTRTKEILAFADALEDNRAELMAILVHEAGKTIADARDELREAVDFCRYYAANALKDFDAAGVLMAGYTGETNRLTMQGCGVFVCISPWNFPLAIFTGQIVAALLAGNSVIAKAASQTRYIASRTVALMHEAGVPVDALHLLHGGGAFGGKIVAHKDVAGVAFTGSTATAKIIQKTLAEENARIVPLIAETGGQNAMIVDSSALPEQIVDDVIASAFGSAGQRCSALRVLYLQEDIADNVLSILKGAMVQMKIGNPVHLSSDVGYVIDDESRQMLDDHAKYLKTIGSLVHQCMAGNEMAENGRIFSPTAYEIPNIHVLEQEVFGPILHIIRYKADKLDSVIRDINGTGFGLTFGLHSRIQMRQDYISAKIDAGNIYVNRSMTGAVVGVQPFGGMGLSGTGPKAGSPHYLHAFATEKVVTTDTTASGGNASLISLEE